MEAVMPMSNPGSRLYRAGPVIVIRARPALPREWVVLPGESQPRSDRPGPASFGAPCRTGPRRLVLPEAQEGGSRVVTSGQLGAHTLLTYFYILDKDVYSNQCNISGLYEEQSDFDKEPITVKSDNLPVIRFNLLTVFALFFT